LLAAGLLVRRAGMVIWAFSTGPVEGITWGGYLVLVWFGGGAG